MADSQVSYIPDNGALVITYNPRYSDELNYLVAHECGHILRFWHTPPEERKMPYCSQDIKAKAVPKLAADYAVMLLKGIPPEFLIDSFDDMYTAVVRQLVTLPCDARIDKWIFTSCKGLRNVQEKSLRRLIAECTNNLDPGIKHISPPSIYKASNAMNYAYGKFLNSFINVEPFLSLYRGTDYESVGNKLLEYLFEEDTGYSGDRKTVDAWANTLGMESWYDWKGLEEIGNDEKE